MQLLLETSVLNIKLDINTYMKLLTGVYINLDGKINRHEIIDYLFSMLNNDHAYENSAFVTEIVQAYVSNTFEQSSFLKKDNLSF